MSLCACPHNGSPHSPSIPAQGPHASDQQDQHLAWLINSKMSVSLQAHPRVLESRLDVLLKLSPFGRTFLLPGMCYPDFPAATVPSKPSICCPPQLFPHDFPRHNQPGAISCFQLQGLPPRPIPQLLGTSWMIKAGWCCCLPPTPIPGHTPAGASEGSPAPRAVEGAVMGDKVAMCHCGGREVPCQTVLYPKPNSLASSRSYKQMLRQGSGSGSVWEGDRIWYLASWRATALGNLLSLPWQRPKQHRKEAATPGWLQGWAGRTSRQLGSGSRLSWTGWASCGHHGCHAGPAWGGIPPLPQRRKDKK